MLRVWTCHHHTSGVTVLPLVRLIRQIVAPERKGGLVGRPFPHLEGGELPTFARYMDSSFPSRLFDQVQVIKPLTEDEQVLVVSECDATADHPAGGPATAVAVILTFCEAVKPWAEPLPEKYVPALSAA